MTKLIHLQIVICSNGAEIDNGLKISIFPSFNFGSQINSHLFNRGKVYKNRNKKA